MLISCWTSALSYGTPTFYYFSEAVLHDTIRCDRREFNVDSKAECVQLNLSHVARKQPKQTDASAHLLQNRFNIREGSPEEIKDYGGKIL